MSGGEFEKDSLDVKRLMMVVIGIGVMGVMVFAFSAWLMNGFGHEAAKTAQDTELPARLSGPRLQIDEPKDLAELRRGEDKILNSYAWTDASHRTARVPIGRALEIFAKREGVKP